MWVFTFKYDDGSVLTFGAAEWALETTAGDFEKPWFAFGMQDNGVGFVKTEGLAWATVTKDPA